MRLEGKIKLGFYPLPVTEADRIRRFLHYPEKPCAAIDPCIGDGVAFATVTREAPVLRYGIELDAYRAEQAGAVAHEVIHGSVFDVHCSVESLSLLYLNPPYDFEWGENHNGRMERIFLEQIYRWLKPGGLLVFVIPGQRLCSCNRVLATHFRDKRVYRLSAPDAEKYGQVVVFGVRRTRYERDRLRDTEVIRARNLLEEMSRTQRIRYQRAGRSSSSIMGCRSMRLKTCCRNRRHTAKLHTFCLHYQRRFRADL